MKGRFFAFEGIDGSGKSTQLALLATALENDYGKAYVTKEPTEGPIGSLLRQMLTGRVKADYRVMAQLFAADRLDHLTNEVDGVLGQLEQGVTVLCDRYYFSSYAYHGVDMPMEKVIQANEIAASLLRPTATIYIDISPEIALERIGTGRFHRELFETQERLTQTQQNYEKAFALLGHEEKIIRIDGNRSSEVVAQEVYAKVKELL